MEQIIDARPSPITGRWYPADPEELTQQVDHFLRAGHNPTIEGEVVAVIAPHAGYRYSGAVAGKAFAAVQGLAPDLVAILAPMHYPFPEALLVSTHSHYETPLGLVEIDQEAVRLLGIEVKQELGIELSAIAKDPEHALEAELPFLQRALAKPFKLLPVMVRDQSVEVAGGLGRALARVLAGRNALLVASSDLSHFYPEDVAQSLDAELLRRLEAFDAERVMTIEEEGKGYACGRAAMAAVLWAAEALGANQVKVLGHSTSAQVTDDYSEVVGYAAAVVTRRPG